MSLRVAERTGAVVALKGLAGAKSRFVDAGPALRRRLAWCMAVDTLTALADTVDQLVLVTAEPAIQGRLRRAGLSITVLAEPVALLDNQRPTGGEHSLNAALRAGIAALVGSGADRIIATVGDLPALRPASVARILAGVGDRPIVIPDLDDIGSTMIAGPPGSLDPQFGGASARRHRHAGAAVSPELDQLVDARADVDNPAALATAFRIGLGPWTAALVDDQGTLLARPRAAR